MKIHIPETSTVSLTNDLTEMAGIHLSLKREDQNHPLISGNKLRKLKYNLMEAHRQEKKQLLTFGGAFSNHIYAVAAAGKEYGFNTIGIIRGEETLPLNPTLRFAQDQGMHLHYINRNAYRDKYSEALVNEFRILFGDFYQIPEGGSNALAVKGTSEIIADIGQQYDYYCCPAGTGGTAAGLIHSLSDQKKALIFPALKGDFMSDEIDNLLNQFINDDTNYLKDKYEVISDYHFGGYAKFKPELITFINAFKQEFNIPLDPIYTGKMMYGIFDKIENKYFEPGSHILAIHTGGLQGIAGFNDRYGNLLI